MKKMALTIIIITLLTRILGFGREIVLAHYYGASYITDAYLISLTIPMTIFGFVGAAINVGYIPLYSKIENDQSLYDADRYTSNLINFFLILSLIIFSICYLFAEQLVSIFAMGFDEKTFKLATQFTRISLLGLFFSLLISVSSAYLQIKKSFIIPVLIGVPFNIIIIGSIVLSTKGNLSVLAIGSLVALIAQFVFLAIFVFKKGYKYDVYIDIKDNNIRKMFFVVIPSITGVSVSQINMIVDRTIASTIVIGGVSSLNYANRIIQMVQGIFVLSIINIFYPTMSTYSSKGDFTNFKTLIKEIISVISIIILPCTIGLIILRTPIVNLLYGRGNFNEHATIMTSQALLFYSIGLMGYSLREILARAFYAMEESKIPAKNAALAMVVNIILNYILSRFLGIGGLAFATSIAATFTTILLFINLRKKIGPFGMKQISITFIKILFASLIMGFISKISFNYLTNFLSQNISLLTAIAIGVVSYFVIIYFMKIEDVDVIVGAIKKKLNKSAA